MTVLRAPWYGLEVMALCGDVGTRAVPLRGRPDRARCGCCGRSVPIEWVDVEHCKNPSPSCRSHYVPIIVAHRIRIVVEGPDHWETLVAEGRLTPATIARYDGARR